MSVDNLIVRLLGDSTQFIDSMEAATTEAEKMALVIDRETSKIVDQYKKAGFEVSKDLEQMVKDVQTRMMSVSQLVEDGSITAEQYGEVMAALTEEISKQGEEMRRVAEEEAKTKEQGEALTRRYMTAQEKFNEQMDHYSDLLLKGAIDQKTFGNALEEALDTLNRSGTKVESLSEKLRGYGQTMIYVGGAIAGVFGLTIRQGVNAAAQYETTVASFKTMIGSLEETQQTMQKLSQFAVEAPMTMPQIEQAAMGLIQFGERGDAMIHTLEILGNAAAGTGTHFNLLSSVFNQVRGVGHLLTGDFRQLSTRGVLSLQDIAKHFDVTEAAAGKMLSTGKISFASFKAILENLSKEGGRFHNMMADQSKTLEGQMAKLSDAVGIAIRDLGQKFMPIIKMATGAANSIMDYWQSVPDVLKSAAAAVMGLTFALGTGLAAIGGWVLAVPSMLGFISTLASVSWLAAAGQAAASLATGAWTLLMMPASAGIATMIGAVTAFDISLATLGGTIIFLEGLMVRFLSVVASPAFLLAGAAIIVAGTAWLIYGDNLKKAREEVEKLKKSNADITKEVDKAQVAAVKKAGDLKGDKKEDFTANMIADANEREIMLSKQLQLKEELLAGFQGDLADKFDMGGGDYAQKSITKQEIENLKEQLAQLKPIKEEWVKQMKSIKESGVTEDIDEANTERNKGIEKRIRALAAGGSDKMFDPAGDAKNNQHLAEMKFEGFNDQRIAEAKRLQDKERKASANEELLGLRTKGQQELSLIGMTNKELLTKKYTMEGISKLKAEELADLQLNLSLSQELNKLQEQNRDLGLTPHQIRKGKAEREGANPEGMALVDNVRDQENQTLIKGLQQEYDLLGLTNDQRVIKNMLDSDSKPADIQAVRNLQNERVLKTLKQQYDLMLLTNDQLAVKMARENGASAPEIKALEALQAQIKERGKLKALEDSVRSSNEGAEQEIEKMRIATSQVRVQTDLWKSQAQVRKDAQDLEFLRLQGVDNELLKQKELYDLEKNKLALIKEQIDKGAEIREGLKTPQEKLKEELQRIQESLGTTMEEKAKASARLVAGYMENNPTVQQAPNKALTAGSTDFLKFMSERRRERTKKNRAKTQSEILLDKQNVLTKEIITELQNMGVLARVR